MTQERYRPYLAALWLACILYLSACALPATKNWGTTDYGRGGNLHYVTYYGWSCLAFGWIAVPVAVEQISPGYLAWLANPLALASVSLLIFRRAIGAAAFGIASVIVSALYMIDPPSRDGNLDLPQIGAWLWLGSLLALTAAALIRRANRQLPLAP